MYTPVFFPDPLAGGRSLSVKSLAEALSERGLTVGIASYWRGRESSYGINSVRVYRIFTKPGNRYLEYLALPLVQVIEASRLKRIAEDYDLLHVHGPTRGFTFPPKLSLAFFKGWKRVAAKELPSIVHFRSTLGPEARRYIRGYDAFLRNALNDMEGARLVVTLNRRTANELKRIRPDLEVEVVYNYVDDAFLNVKGADEYPDRFTVLYLGGKLSYKGYSDVLKIKSVLEKFDPSIRFTIIGPGIRKVPYNEMPRVYLSSSVLLLPSYREGMPRAVLEALALQRPVVASNVGGIPEVVRDGVNGFLARPGNVKLFVKRILELKRDPQLLREMGRAGRETILKEFTKDKAVTKLVRIYERVLGRIR